MSASPTARGIARPWWLIRSPWGRASSPSRDPMRALSLRRHATLYAVAFALGAGRRHFRRALCAARAIHRSTPFRLACSPIAADVVRSAAPATSSAVPRRHRCRLLPEWLRFAQGYYLMGYAILVMC